MATIPRSIRISLIAFFLAFLCEASVEAILLWYLPLKPTGWIAVIASLIANPLALAYSVRRRKWAFSLLKWIAALGIVWTVSGGPYLYSLGVWAIALIAISVWLRVVAFLMIRRKAAKDWIDTATI
ncbi:MAG TPA: hypothetical protein VF534_19590 [Paraburkholderia sp.]